MSDLPNWWPWSEGIEWSSPTHGWVLTSVELHRIWEGLWIGGNSGFVRAMIEAYTQEHCTAAGHDRFCDKVKRLLKSKGLAYFNERTREWVAMDIEMRD